METQLEHIINIARYLRSHCEDVGVNKYLKSHVRAEHGTGSGFGAVSNTGSSDCLKERFRDLGVKLGAKFDRVDQILFKTELGGSVTQDQRTKDNLLVEHTLELKKDIYPLFEADFIINKINEIEPKKVLKWFILYHIATAIHPEEQLKGEAGKVYKLNNFQYPFRKYSAPVFYNGKDVSNYTLEQIQEINLSHHGDALDVIDENNITNQVDKLTKAIGREKKKHTLPPLELAKKYHDDEVALLENWYTHKKNKLFSGSWSKKPRAKELREKLTG